MKKSLSDTAAGHSSRHTAGPIQVDAAGSAGSGRQVITRQGKGKGRGLSPWFQAYLQTYILPSQGASHRLSEIAKFPQEKRTCAGGLGCGFRFGCWDAVRKIYILSPGYLFLHTFSHMFHKLYLPSNCCKKCNN
jgi:hypothetical protein